MMRNHAILGALLAGAVLAGTAPASAGIDGEIFYAGAAVPGGAFDDRANVSGDRDESELPRVAAAAGAVHLVWKNGTVEDIAYRRRPAGSASFDESVNVSESGEDSSEAVVAVAGDDVHVLWAEEDPGSGEDEVYGRRSDDGGRGFGRRSNVSATPDMHTRDPSLAAGENLLVVVFEEDVDGNDEIFARRSRDGGRSWEEADNVSGDAEQSTEPAVAVAGETVHVVWQYRGEELDVTDDRIAYARSTDAGAAYEEAVLLPADVALQDPAVAAEGDTVHVAACVPADKSGVFDSEALYYRSDDAGRSWSDPANLSDNPGECKKPAVAAGEGHVYVVWADTTTGRADILMRHSGDGGERFDPVVNVSESRGESEDPTVAVDAADGSVHVVWTDFSVDTPPVSGAAAFLAPAAVVGRRRPTGPPRRRRRGRPGARPRDTPANAGGPPPSRGCRGA